MRAWFIALALIAAPSLALAKDFAAGSLTIAHPFVRSTPPGVKSGAGYMTIANGGTEPDQLLAIETPAAAGVEFHQTVVTDGVARMVPVPEGFTIAPGASTVIGENGTHAMLVGLTSPLVTGETIDATLVFERAGRVPVVLAVEPITTPTTGHGAGHD